jgi:hypothetical protein
LHACSNEKAASFRPYAEMDSVTSNLMTLNVFFPVRDGLDEPMYLDSLTLNVPNKLSVELKMFYLKYQKSIIRLRCLLIETLLKMPNLLGHIITMTKMEKV